LSPGRGRTPAADRKLWLSPHTVVSHLKKMYGKTACHSRTELVARLFFDHYLPRIAAGMPPGADGWFR